MNNAVINAIHNILGATHASNYSSSAYLFKAVIETDHKRRYFIESSQFVSSRGEKLPREYCLKFISDTHVYKIRDFINRAEAMRFYENMEFLKNGALVLERFMLSRDQYDSLVNLKGYFDKPLYDNGYNCYHSNQALEKAVTYCEGNVVKLHVPDFVNRKTRDEFLTFHNENN